MCCTPLHHNVTDLDVWVGVWQTEWNCKWEREFWASTSNGQVPHWRTVSRATPNATALIVHSLSQEIILLIAFVTEMPFLLRLINSFFFFLSCFVIFRTNGTWAEQCHDTMVRRAVTDGAHHPTPTRHSGRRDVRYSIVLFWLIFNLLLHTRFVFPLSDATLVWQGAAVASGALDLVRSQIAGKGATLFRPLPRPHRFGPHVELVVRAAL